MNEMPDLSDLTIQTFLTKKEAAALLRVHVRTIDKWASQGLIRRVALKPPGSKQPDPRFVAQDLLKLLTAWEPGQFGHGGIAPEDNPRGKLGPRKGSEGGRVTP